MAKRVIDNQFCEMTNEEWNYFQKLCQSYDNPPSVRGVDLFSGLFESDENGIITFIKPPHNRMTTFEVFLFIVSLTVHQHLRIGEKMIGEAVKRLSEKEKQLDEKLAQASAILENLEGGKKNKK